MTTVSIEDFCAAIYCGFTDVDAFKPRADGEIAFTAEVTNARRKAFYRVEFGGVSDYRFASGSKHELHSPEDRLELTVVEIDGHPGAWRAWFNPWSLYEYEFCAEWIRINGAEVVGTGRHLQDWLPPHRPAVPPYSAGAV